MNDITTIHGPKDDKNALEQLRAREAQLKQGIEDVRAARMDLFRKGIVSPETTPMDADEVADYVEVEAEKEEIESAQSQDTVVSELPIESDRGSVSQLRPADIGEIRGARQKAATAREMSTGELKATNEEIVDILLEDPDFKEIVEILLENPRYKENVTYLFDMIPKNPADRDEVFMMLEERLGPSVS